MKVGIAGSGFMGVTHAQAWSQVQGVEIVGFVGRGEANRKRRVQEYGGADFASLEEMLKATEAEVVDVCLPTYMNRQAVEIAAAAGKHILLEKPIALTVEDAEAIVQAATCSGVRLMVAHVIRFWPQYRWMRDALGTGQFGQIRCATAARLCEMPPWTEWYADQSRSGGVFVTLGIHDLDFSNWVLGKPRTVFAQGHRTASGTWTELSALVTYESGAVASLQSNIAMPAGYPFTMQFRATSESAGVEYLFRAGVNIEGRETALEELAAFEGGVVTAPQVERRDAYLNEVEYFAECVRTGQPFELAPVEDSVLALRTALAAYESAESGKPVTVG